VAKARDIPGISGDVPYAVAAARVIRMRSDELVEHSRDVLDMGAIERVHDMRVATRRLRAALEVFKPCFPKDEHKAALREVKAIADALGERRDRDVTVAALEDFGDSLAAPDRPGIDSLVASIKAEQERANQALAGFVDASRLEALRELLEGLVQAAEDAGAEAADQIEAVTPAPTNGAGPEAPG
jgi:CHAD domain-containing protein